MPSSDAGYTSTYSNSTTLTVANGDTIWLLSTAQDGVTKLYYKITVTVSAAPLSSIPVSHGSTTSGGGYLPGYGPRANLPTILPVVPPTVPTTLPSNTCSNGKTPKSNCTTAPTIFTFTQNLRFNQTNSLIKTLQQYLNSHGFPVSIAGPGSLNNETNYFGPKTKLALMKFQKAHGLVPDGIVGPLTRGEMNK